MHILYLIISLFRSTVYPILISAMLKESLLTCCFNRSPSNLIAIIYIFFKSHAGSFVFFKDQFLLDNNLYTFFSVLVTMKKALQNEETEKEEL